MFVLVFTVVVAAAATGSKRHSAAAFCRAWLTSDPEPRGIAFAFGQSMWLQGRRHVHTAQLMNAGSVGRLTNDLIGTDCRA